MHQSRAFVRVLACVATAGAASGAWAFDYGVNTLPSVMIGMSYDGSMVYGGNGRFTSDSATYTDPVAEFGDLYIRIRYSGLNDDGSAAIATIDNTVANSQGCFHREGQPIQTFGSIQLGGGTEGVKISGDGNVVAVMFRGYLYTEAYIARTDGQQFPPTPPNEFHVSTIHDLSRDGNSYIGDGYSNGPFSFVWTAGVGAREIAGGEPRTISANGSVIAGFAFVGSRREACVWIGDEQRFLGVPDGYVGSEIREMNDDGTMLIGVLQTEPFGAVPALWTEGTGWIDPASFFALHGVILPVGMQITSVKEVSSDGRTFLCNADRTGLVIVIPAPSSAIALSLGLFAMRRRR